MDEDNEQRMGDLVTYEIDYGDAAMEGGAEYTEERYQAKAGGNVASIIEDYAEANDYEIREIEGKGALALDLDPLETNCLQVAMDHFREWFHDLKGSEHPDDWKDDDGDAKLASIESLHAKVMAATKGAS